MAAARELGYQPNRLAQAMRSGRTKIVSVWIPIDRQAPNYHRALNALNRHSISSGYQLLINGLEAKSAYGAGDNLPQLWPVDGLIAIDAGRALRQLRESPASKNIATVVLGADEYDYTDTIGWDVESGVVDIMRRLAHIGSTSIAFVTAKWIVDNFPNEKRKKAYLAGCEELGLAPDVLIADDESIPAAHDVVHRALERGCRPDAVIGFTDTMALGAMRALTKFGISIPEDCQIVGYGDYPEGDCSIPSLASLTIPTNDCIEIAWKWLLERIENPKLPSRIKYLPMSLKEGESLRPMNRRPSD